MQHVTSPSDCSVATRFRNRTGALFASLIGVVLSSCAFHWEPAFEELAPLGAFDSVAIATLDEALTLARIERDGEPRVVAVRSYENGEIAAVDMSRVFAREVSNPAQLFREAGYEAIAAAVVAARPEAMVRARARDLVLPLDLGDEHIAAGTNFPEHAGESGVERGPFLFPKLVRPTTAYASVPATQGLLDYEVELAFVPLSPLAPRDKPATMGIVLCNDYTDRESLLRHADPWDVESGKGFTTGKSFPGYLPIGNLLVIPRDLHRFIAATELRLYVNRHLRQREQATAMIWDLDELLQQTWERAGLLWLHQGRQVSLLGGATVVNERRLLLGGTPHGTVFAGITTTQKLRGLGHWLAGLGQRSLPEHVIDAYIADARAAGIYLKPGDEVVIHVDKLGVIANHVRAVP